MSIDDRLRGRFEASSRYHELVRRAEAMRSDPRPEIRRLASRRLDVLLRAGTALEHMRRP